LVPFGGTISTMVTNSPRAILDPSRERCSRGVLATTAAEAVDFTWGSASHNQYFRNRVYDGLRPQINYGVWEMDIFKTHYYENVVGNVFGRTGFERIYETENKDFNLYGDRGSYRLGYVNGGDDTAEGNDPKVKKNAQIRKNLKIFEFKIEPFVI